MTKDDWEFLIKKFGSEDHKVISERNSANRSKVVLKHTSGSVSHAKVFDDETKKNGGVAPGMLDFYTKLHTHKDGTPADVESARIITEVNEEIAHQEGENADPVNKDQIFQLVKEGNPERNKKRNMRPRVDRAAATARLRQLEENLAIETAQRREMEARLEEMYADRARQEEMERKAEREKREEVERRLKELADDTARNKELDRRFELLEDDRARNAELARKLEECMSKVNNCSSVCASLMSGGNEHEDAWDEEETYDEQEEANRKTLKLAGKKHNKM